MATIVSTDAPAAEAAEGGRRTALPDRVESIQWLRGVAALLVVAIHAGVMAFHRSGDSSAHSLMLFNAIRFGNSGVDLFFVISGFVMAHSLGRAESARSFLIARWRRIWPLFVLASLVFIALFGTADMMTLPRLLPSFAILPLSETTGYHQPALTVGWTLGFEVMFYLLVAMTIARRGGPPMLLMLTIAAATVGLVITMPWAPARMLFNSITFEFAFGIAVWLIWSRDWGRGWRPALFGIGILLLAGYIAGIQPLIVPANPLLVVGEAFPMNRTLAWGLPWALVVLGLLGETGIGGIAARALGRLGDASYSIYLFHFTILEATATLIPLPRDALLAFFLTGFVLSAVGGLAIYRWIERPLLGWFRRRRRAADPAADGPNVSASAAPATT